MDKCLNIPHNIKIEFGFEKEFLLQATDRNSGQIFNLNFASELLKYLANYKMECAFVEEYSLCLIEVVSPPYPTELVFKGLKTINSYQDFLQTQLKNLVTKYFPQITNKYEVFIVDEGSSQTNLYLNPDLTIQSDQASDVDLVLTRYKKLVMTYKDLSWNIGGINERMIGAYNHITSFHITTHPTFTDQSTVDTYLQALDRISKLVDEYEVFDHGNKFIMRNGQTFILKENLRDIFLKKFLPLYAPEENALFKMPVANGSQLRYLASLTKLLMDNYHTTDVDYAFKKWNSFNLRPRIINTSIPAIEIRRFGSNFSKSKAIKKMLRSIIAYDRIGYKD